jgi:carbon-monoxide dehydrogenase large subunit
VDARLVVGRGRFSDDVTLLGQLHAIMLRSPHAHAIIRSIQTRSARDPRRASARE